MAAAELLFPKLAVFGATGRTGLLLVQQALAKGHSVAAVVRNLEKFQLKHENLEVVKGDVFDADSITPILEGKNAVVSCLGFQVGAKTLYSKSITSIITAAERSSIKRLVGLSGVIAQKDPIDPGWMEWLLRKLVRSRLNDLMAMENIVMNSNLCYTLVRLPFLTQGPLTDDYLVTNGQSVPRGAFSVSRADVAHFMLKSLQTNQWDNKAVRIATKK
ncbi:flavin reductase (NADPH)-like isoform X1 [Orbicella faveolata]|uniref:flavin reductase (NADPH)-like isoform X1 n=1 Tax=Orbicella faveolata TaxID=48498 RepID=UPI0009E30ED7|nr:flavin reductase (NADPH)-like isoform X1 [Orbicella faveolata]